jgi:hypothetical protein
VKAKWQILVMSFLKMKERRMDEFFLFFSSLGSEPEQEAMHWTMNKIWWKSFSAEWNS